jgi:hypothetical protein
MGDQKNATEPLDPFWRIADYAVVKGGAAGLLMISIVALSMSLSKGDSGTEFAYSFFFVLAFIHFAAAMFYNVKQYGKMLVVLYSIAFTCIMIFLAIELSKYVQPPTTSTTTTPSGPDANAPMPSIGKTVAQYSISGANAVSPYNNLNITKGTASFVLGKCTFTSDSDAQTCNLVDLSGKTLAGAKGMLGVAFWIKKGAPATRCYLVRIGTSANAAPGTSLAITLEPSGGIGVYTSANDSRTYPPLTGKDGEWRLVFVQQTSTDFTVAIDGTAQPSVAGTGTPSHAALGANTLLIGGIGANETVPGVTFAKLTISYAAPVA